MRTCEIEMEGKILAVVFNSGDLGTVRVRFSSGVNDKFAMLDGDFDVSEFDSFVKALTVTLETE